MAAKKVKVTYQDGREVEVKVTPRAQVMAEEYCNGFKQERGVLATFYLGWAALNKAGKESMDFETWLDQIDDVEDVTWLDDVEEAANEPLPTQPDPSGDTSSD